MSVDLQNIGQRWRTMRFNPLRSLTPERLAAALDSWSAGWLREAALIFETIGEREAIVRSVLTKRAASVSRRDWEIVIPDKDDPRAEAHKETLEYFYDNLTVTDATDLNVRSGMSGLIRQMMDAILQKYAVHEIVWRPTAGGLTAELRRVPIYFFENRSGKLRFIGPETRADGQPLEEDGWMITVAEGLGQALSICYMFRRLGVQDWVAYSEKFSIPGVLGRTRAAANSPEALAFASAVDGFSSDWVGVVTGDDGSIADPIKTITAGNGAGLPQKDLAEYFDKMISCLVRGGDLATLSQKDSTGANSQEGEAIALLEDDCQMITETLQTQLDKLVIRMVHGDESPAAYVVINPPSNKDLTKDLAIDAGLKAMGITQDPEDLAERYGRTALASPVMGHESSVMGEEEEKDAAANAYNEAQARHPKGVRDGGRWVKAPSQDKIAVFIDQGTVDANNSFMVKTLASLHPTLEKHGVSVSLRGKNVDLGTVDVGGQQLERGGQYQSVVKTITSYADPGIVAHEMGHAEIDYALHQRKIAIERTISRVESDGSDIYASENGLFSDDRIKQRSPEAAVHNALLTFENALRADGAHPTNYSKAWLGESIIDYPGEMLGSGQGYKFYKTVDHRTNGMFSDGTPIVLSYPIGIPRHVNEAYAEFNQAYVLGELSKKGIVEVPKANAFDKIGTPESRKIFKVLRDAIHKTAK